MTSQVTPVRLGVIGCGAIATTYHLPALAKLPGHQLVACCDLILERAQSMAGQYGFAHTYTNYQDLLARSDIDAVMVLTPNYTHSAIGCDVARAGKHIFLQKPMARSRAECQAVIDAAAEKGVQLFMSFMHRYQPEVQVARQLLQQGVIGRPETVHIRNMPGGTSTVSGWFFRRENVGGGALLDVGVHGIDVLRYLFGEIEEVLWARCEQTVESVVSRGDRYYPDNEDLAQAAYRLPGGTVALHEVTWHQRQRVDRFSLEIFGSKGSLLLRQADGPLYLWTHQAGAWSTPEVPTEPFGLVQHREFLTVVANGTPPSCTGNDGLRAVAVAEEVYRKAGVAPWGDTSALAPGH